VWGSEVDGRVLTFRLAGINNQNFLMRDEETGSYWQQISGKAISGPLRGKQLSFVHWDELSFEAWRDENPRGMVMLPVGQYASQYAAKDWETKMKKARTVVDTSKTGLDARELMVGVEASGASRAYRHERVLSQKLIQDRVGGEAILLVVGLDGKSVRGFFAELPESGVVPEFYRKEELGGGLFVDSETGGEWNFQGCAVSGALARKCLAPLKIVKDYWFDWQLYHPQTSVAK
jgi:hypothetical protein